MQGRDDSNDPLTIETAEALDLLRETAADLCRPTGDEPSLRLLALAQAIGVPGALWSHEVADWPAERLAGAIAVYLQEVYEWPYSRAALERAAMQASGYPEPTRRPALRLVCGGGESQRARRREAYRLSIGLRELRHAYAHQSGAALSFDEHRCRHVVLSWWSSVEMAHDYQARLATYWAFLRSS